MLLRVLEDTTNTECAQNNRRNNIYMRGSVVAFPIGNEILLKYNFSLAITVLCYAEALYSFRKSQKFGGNVKPSGYGEFEEKLRKRRSRLQLEMKKHKQ